jgi:hypothetical protein
MSNKLCNCIALYDYSPDHCDLKHWFYYMDAWAEKIGIPWESIGSNLSRKLLLYKNGKKRIEKSDFNRELNIEIYGGVSEPGTYLDWQTCANFFIKDNGLRHTAVLCFPESQKTFSQENLISFLKELLKSGNFKYGICYQRPYNLGPEAYAGGTNQVSAKGVLDDTKRKKISTWFHEYIFDDGAYRTGLLRDVYPFNLLIDVHLREKVGKSTLEAWINSDPKHGALEKITDIHWLWSIEPEHIPIAQEALQEAGLLLCYKV